MLRLRQSQPLQHQALQHQALQHQAPNRCPVWNGVKTDEPHGAPVARSVVRRGAPVVRSDVKRGELLVSSDVRHGAECTCSPTSP